MVRRRMLLFAVAVPLSACGGDSYDDCSGTPVEKRLTVETPTDPPLQLKVDSCRVDIDACLALCTMAMSRVHSITPSDFPVDSCDVSFAGDEVIMNVRYTNYGNNCFFGDDVVGPGGF